MHRNEITQPSVGARFIAPTADLSAFGGWYDVRMKKLLCMIAPVGDAAISQFCDEICW